MRSLTDLIAQAHPLGICDEEGRAGIANEVMHRSELMDAIRDRTGDFDPSVQLDPAKAQDLKHDVDWTLKGRDRFVSVEASHGTGWVAEPKLDGARIRLFLGAKTNTMNTGRRSDVTYAYIERADNFPHLRDALLTGMAGTVLDGELMPPSSSLTTVSGVTTKGTLNSAMALLNVNPAAAVATQEKHGRARLMAFDVLMLAGEDVTHMPYEWRRAALEKIVWTLNATHPDCSIDLIPQHAVTADFIQGCLDDGYEGVILKKVGHVYLPGKRMASWLKVKAMSTGDFYIIGSVDGKGRNEGKVGSLRVAWRSPTSGPEGVYCADVAGITDAFRDELTGPDGAVKNEYLGTVIEVMAQGRTKNGRLRHPHFVRLRPDKSAYECTADCSIDLFTEV